MKKVAGMATIQARQESMFDTLKSLSPQLDEIHVYLNDYDSISPIMKAKELLLKNVKFHLGKNLDGDLGDAAKFYFAEEFKSDYYFTVDDDLIYSDTYVNKHIAHLNYFSNSIITTYHARSFTDFPLKGYLKPQTLMMHHACLGTVSTAAWVQFGGTGVMCMVPEKVLFNKDIFGEERNIADVWIGIHSQRNNIPILVIPHNVGEVLATDKIDHLKDSIWGESVQEDRPCHLINKELDSLKFITAVKNLH